MSLTCGAARTRFGGRRAVAATFAPMLAIATAIVAFGSEAAAASGVAGQPLRVRTASLTQDGQELVWRLRLAAPFSPGGLERDARSLCLLIERPKNDSVSGQLCVAGPAKRSGRPRVLYAQITSKGSGRAHVISATVRREGNSGLVASFLPSAVHVGYRPLRWQVISTLAAAACAPSAPNSGDCFELFPASPKLLRVHTPVLVGCVPRGPSLVSNGPARGREIALTFDDGPWNTPPTTQFLDVLEREHVVATFFEIGDQIPEFDPRGAIERRMLRDGDMIGDHTWTHPSMPSLSPSAQRAQLLSTAATIRRATGGFAACLWRPPYGAISSSLVAVARSLGLLTIMWSVDTRDWSLPGTDAIYGTVVSNARSGSIVLQHFGGGPRYETLAALPREIQTLRRRGYRFVTVAQLLGLKLLYR